LCLPLGGDQPLIAWRVADELGIGIKLLVDSDLSVNRVKNAVSELLDDPIYRKRVTDLSIISKRFVGHKLAVQHIINYLHQNEAFHDNSRQTISTSTMSLLNRS
jgi:UDP:flavonoid glycosyltransferase YjiC (YdhE family)